MMATQRLALAVLLAVVALVSPGHAEAQQSTMSFFVTSSGPGNDVEDLHRANSTLTKQTALSEKGEVVNGLIALHRAGPRAPLGALPLGVLDAGRVLLGTDRRDAAISA